MNEHKPKTTVGAFEAKTHLSALLERVARGETITITRHGKAVAKLVPAAEAPPSAEEIKRREHAIARIRELSKGQTLGGIDWRELRDEGRKW